MDMATAPDLSHQNFTAAVPCARRSQIRVLDTEAATLPRFIEQWRELAASPAEPNPFFEPWFLLPSLRQLSEGSAVTIKAFYCDDQLRGIMPIRRSNRYYGYPVSHAGVWLHDNAFCGAPLVSKGYELAFWRAALAHFDQSSRHALFLHLPLLPSDGPMTAALDTVIAETHRAAFNVDSGERAMLPCTGNPDAYLERAMSAKKRKELRRQRKRLGEEGELTVERSDDADSIAEWIDEFLALEEAGWKGEQGSALASSQSTGAFFTSALSEAARAGRLERLSLRLDGRAIAMLANFMTPPGAFSFKTTFDEAYARYSPGLLLQIENLALISRKDIAWADSCAAQGHPMIERIWREKRRFVSRNIAIGGPARRLAFRALMAYETRGNASL